MPLKCAQVSITKLFVLAVTRRIASSGLLFAFSWKFHTMAPQLTKFEQDLILKVLGRGGATEAFPSSTGRPCTGL